MGARKLIFCLVVVIGIGSYIYLYKDDRSPVDRDVVIEKTEEPNISAVFGPNPIPTDPKRWSDPSVPISTVETVAPPTITGTGTGSMPRSATELTSKITEYSDPDMGSNLVPYGDPNTRTMGHFCGAYEGPDGQLYGIEIDRSTAGVSLTIEEPAEGYRHFGTDTMDLKQFNGDELSIVMSISQSRMIYLKFHRDEKRVMRGWILPWRGRVAVLDCWSDYNNGGSSGKRVWPGKDETVQYFLDHLAQ